MIDADWDDVHPAVSLMAQYVEMALVTWSPGTKAVASTDLQTFELLTITDEPATLTARRTPAGITLTATVGHFGNPTRERQLLEAVARRLADLKGVDTRLLR